MPHPFRAFREKGRPVTDLPPADVLNRRLDVLNPSFFMSFIPIASFFLPHLLAQREAYKPLVLQSVEQHSRSR